MTQIAPFHSCMTVEMVPNQVMGEMVLDEGGKFIPASVDGLHTLSLLLASRAARDRATEDTHKHHTGNNPCAHQARGDTTWVQYVILDREVLTPSPCE